MSEAVIDSKIEAGCEDNACSVVVDEHMDKLVQFEDAINRCGRFQILGTTHDDEYVKLYDTTKEKAEEGNCVEFPISEIFRVPIKDVLNTAKQDRPDIICKSYTRIVGYYSATHNWNASKLGELRDRQNGNYGTPNHKDVHKEETVTAVNRLSFA
jgi:hypothetical protein